MGCVSSKSMKKQLQNECKTCRNHVVSLTSSTYGALTLDKDRNPSPAKEKQEDAKEKQEDWKEHILVIEKETKKMPPSPERQAEDDKPSEVINAWELMGDLEEVQSSPSNGSSGHVPPQKKKSPKLVKQFLDARTPLKFINQIGTPRKARTYGGKENKMKRGTEFSPAPPIKGATPRKPSKASLKLSFTPVSKNYRNGSPAERESSKRKSFSPLFDPELLALYEKDLTQEEEKIKKIIRLTPRSRKQRDAQEIELLLTSFPLKCPPGGHNAVVIYTTTLRGIRKTFEDCNAVRSIFQSYCVQFVERDISMDLGFKEELRILVGSKGATVPAVFVRGRLIGGADAVMKLEEEGKLGSLLDGMPRVMNGACEGCGDVRFVLCLGCNGSTKVLHESGRKVARCGECNENGLIRCPICC